MNQEIIGKLSLEFNLDKEIIEKVIKSQFYFVYTAIEQGEFDSVHLHKWGKYACKPLRLEQFKYTKEQYNDKYKEI